MKIKQLTGPFYAGQVITIPASIDYIYVHIGIQIPKRQPIEYIKEDIKPDLTINGITYKINTNHILEFDGLAELAWIIEFNKDLPMETIIDIVYREETEY